jgi:hypothetical protein
LYVVSWDTGVEVVGTGAGTVVVGAVRGTVVDGEPGTVVVGIVVLVGSTSATVAAPVTLTGAEARLVVGAATAGVPAAGCSAVCCPVDAEAAVARVTGVGIVRSTVAPSGRTAALAVASLGVASKIVVLTRAAAEPAARTPTSERAVAIVVFMVGLLSCPQGVEPGSSPVSVVMSSP